MIGAFIEKQKEDGASLVAETVKNSACNAGDQVSIPVSGRSPGEANSYLLQYPCRENPRDKGVWQATVHRVTEADTTE